MLSQIVSNTSNSKTTNTSTAVSVMASRVQHQQVTTKSADELKERVKFISSLEKLPKEETLKMRLRHLGPSVALFFQENPLKMVQGCGQYLYDELGNEYLDCINNVAHIGHGNKRVMEAVSKQMSLLNTNSRFLHDNLSLYVKRLCGLFPSHLSVCYLVNSGSEANDLAIQLARHYTGRKDIVSVDGAYHGNLCSTMAISPYKTDKLINYKVPKWAHVAPLPCSYRGIYSRDQFSPPLAPGSDTIGCLYASATEQFIEEVKAQGRQVAAFIVESMISCGGQTPLPSGYLRKLQRYLKSQGSLLICDEVQTGFGRSGEKMWGFQLDGDDIRPDIVTIGKPMGNGFPVSAVITTPEVANCFNERGTEYFNTFGGNPVSCAAAIAVLDELEELQLFKRAKEIGDYILKELNIIKSAGSRIIGDVRGCGLFIGIDMVENLETKKPASEYARYIVHRFREERILMSTEGKFGNILKFKPPMVFTMEDAKRFIETLTRILVELELQIGQQQKYEEEHPSSSSSSSVSTSSSNRSSRSASSSSSILG